MYARFVLRKNSIQMNYGTKKTAERISVPTRIQPNEWIATCFEMSSSSDAPRICPKKYAYIILLKWHNHTSIYSLSQSRDIVWISYAIQSAATARWLTCSFKNAMNNLNFITELNRYWMNDIAEQRPPVSRKSAVILKQIRLFEKCYRWKSNMKWRFKWCYGVP